MFSLDGCDVLAVCTVRFLRDGVRRDTVRLDTVRSSHGHVRIRFLGGLWVLPRRGIIFREFLWPFYGIVCHII